MIASSLPAGPNHVDGKSPLGICSGHAYTVLSVLTLSDGTQLLKIRNPWGTENYNGPWSDKSELWTE